MSTNQTSGRFVSRLTQKTLAVILAGGRGSRLHQLTNWRAKPAVHFGGKFLVSSAAFVAYMGYSATMARSVMRPRPRLIEIRRSAWQLLSARGSCHRS